jgi:predicted ATPase
VIRRVELRDLRTHERTVVPLSPLTVLVGPNGSGKTTVLQALDALHALSVRPVGEVFADRMHADLCVRSEQGAFEIAAAGDDWRAAIAFGRDESRPGRAAWNAAFVLQAGGQAEAVRSATDVYAGGVFDVTAAARFLGGALPLALDAARIAEPAPPSPEARIAPDGSGLAAVLARLALEAPDTARAIEDDLRRLVPTFRRLRVRQVLRPTRAREVAFAAFLDFEGAANVPATAASAGTLVALALVTLLHDAEARPGLVLLDDLDRSLHPRAQAEVVDMLRRAQAADPGLQIVAAAHSPYLIDRFALDEVVVTALDAAGVTRCASLASHPKAARMRGVLSTGEFLSAEGEDWVLEARAGA